MQSKIPANPLAKIALSCSGGGYRAASFHLGAMSYLNRLHYRGSPLLENVKMISTVSGGTITGAVYALKKQEGKSFKEIYDFLMEKLHTLDLVKLSIQKLNPEEKLKNPGKRKNLINAFAELYDEHFTGGSTFEVFSTMKSHLEAVVFNSTEFSNAINFRFRNKGSGLFGNKMIPVDQSASLEVKLSDAIASSSCFPGGFEPMIWPHDFVHDKSFQLKALMQQDPSGTGLMDGGIYDNQGTQSILMYRRGEDIPYFDLIIISDVTSPYMDPFKPWQEKNKQGFGNLTLNIFSSKAKKISRCINVYLLVIAAVLVLIPLFWKYSNTFCTGLFLGLGGIPLTLLLLKRLIILFATSAFQKGKNILFKLIPEFYRKKLSALKIEELSIHRAETLLLDRLNSVITLLVSVFLKVVRRLNYADLYNDNKFAYRRISNLVRELTEDDFTGKNPIKIITKDSAETKVNSQLKGDYNTVVGRNIKMVAEEAAGFGTTLWFSDDDQLHNMLDKLIATGQFTMCYNMVDYLEQIIFGEDNGFGALDTQTQGDLKKLYEDCLADWKLFKEKPMVLVRLNEN